MVIAALMKFWLRFVLLLRHTPRRNFIGVLFRASIFITVVLLLLFSVTK